MPVGSFCGLVEGSSPLARGLRVLVVTPVVWRGIIPARAGFTTRLQAGPRSPCGSSPLARGLRARHTPSHERTRIIPARAGFTASASPSTRPQADHPRSRGVYPTFDSINAAIEGSSPLARGLPSPTAHAYRTSGIIPARAGFTSSRSRRTSVTRDHPRSRGVYEARARRDADGLGSSPLARGLRAAASMT